MNRRQIVLSCALVLGMVVGTALAQSPPTSSPSQDPSMQNPPTAPDPTMQRPSVENPSDGPSPSTASASSATGRTFMGSLAKSGGGYVLHSANGDYKLIVNDKDQAQTLEGKDVKITGSLDSNTNTIQVKSMEPSSAE